MNWISVDERLPANGQEILAYVSLPSDTQAARYWAGRVVGSGRGRMRIKMNGIEIGNASHWMPIEPPEDTE